jgi:hypothetical protein
MPEIKNTKTSDHGRFSLNHDINENERFVSSRFFGPAAEATTHPRWVRPLAITALCTAFVFGGFTGHWIYIQQFRDDAISGVSITSSERSVSATNLARSTDLPRPVSNNASAHTPRSPIPLQNAETDDAVESSGLSLDTSNRSAMDTPSDGDKEATDEAPFVIGETGDGTPLIENSPSLEPELSLQGFVPSAGQTSEQQEEQTIALRRQKPVEERTENGNEPGEGADDVLSLGDEFLAVGDVEWARRYYRSGVSQGNAMAAVAMGWTFDPIYRERSNHANVVPDAKRAIAWYREARDMGARSAAEVRLADLRQWLEEKAHLGEPGAKDVISKWPREGPTPR